MAVAAAGFFIAYRVYIARPELAERLALTARPAYQVLLNKYYVDEVYDALFINRAKDVGNVAAAFDLAVVDGAVNSAGWTTRFTAEVSRLWDLWVIDGLVNILAFAVKVLSYPVRVLQTGVVQSYALLIVLGLLVFMGYYWLRL